MSTKSKIILGLVGAAAAGVVVGILLAPDKGSEVRRNIGRTAGDWAEHLTDLFANAKGEIQNLGGKAARTACGAATEAGNKFNDVKESYS